MPVPGQKPLNFVRSIPASGSTVSPSISVITLLFDKNVVNDSVWQNNRKQIRMFRGDTQVAIRVTRIPDTVDFSQRRKIFVRPVNRLRSGSTYTIVIGPGVTSKAGERLGKTVRVVLRTRAGAPVPEE